ncbi:unnamed protein product [Owenia fusiformis]|uniref:Uncharacterized protein n=1 Tax=Owenia fusiformis TaxID=6347 RepID=A0A8J1XKL5_OWEFU|nr:unnamed protein product [Owenia fusiformis]
MEKPSTRSSQRKRTRSSRLTSLEDLPSGKNNEPKSSNEKVEPNKKNRKVNDDPGNDLKANNDKKPSASSKNTEKGFQGRHLEKKNKDTLKEIDTDDRGSTKPNNLTRKNVSPKKSDMVGDDAVDSKTVENNSNDAKMSAEVTEEGNDWVVRIGQNKELIYTSKTPDKKNVNVSPKKNGELSDEVNRSKSMIGAPNQNSEVSEDGAKGVTRSGRKIKPKKIYSDVLAFVKNKRETASKPKTQHSSGSSNFKSIRNLLNNIPEQKQDDNNPTEHTIDDQQQVNVEGYIEPNKLPESITIETLEVPIATGNDAGDNQVGIQESQTVININLGSAQLQDVGVVAQELTATIDKSNEAEAGLFNVVESEHNTTEGQTIAYQYVEDSNAIPSENQENSTAMESGAIEGETVILQGQPVTLESQGVSLGSQDDTTLESQAATFESQTDASPTVKITSIEPEIDGYILQQHSAQNTKLIEIRCGYNGCDYVYTSSEDMNQHLQEMHKPGQAEEASKNVQSTLQAVSDERHPVKKTTELDDQKTEVEYTYNDEMYHQFLEDERVYMCTICSYKERNWKKLLAHLKSHQSFKPYVCTNGHAEPYKTSSKYNMMCHLKIHSGVRNHVCTICNKAFSFKHKLTVHMQYHNNVKNHECNQCGKTFTQSSDLKKHVSGVHTNVRSYECSICGEAWKNKQTLTRHEKTHGARKSLKCDVCGKGYTSKQTLSLHKRSHFMLYHCEICDKSFSSYSGFMAHKAMHDHDGFECELCNKILMTKGSLKRHHIVTHSNMRPFLCPLCQKALKSKESLAQHMITHNSDKTFECPECGLCVKRLDTLQVHMRIHQQKKPYNCDICHKGYTQKNALIRHMETHSTSVMTGTLFNCSTCDESLTSRQALQNHIVEEHLSEDLRDNKKAENENEAAIATAEPSIGELMWVCELCEELFVSQDTLAVHILSMHMKHGLVLQGENAGNQTNVSLETGDLETSETQPSVSLDTGNLETSENQENASLESGDLETIDNNEYLVENAEERMETIEKRINEGVDNKTHDTIVVHVNDTTIQKGEIITTPLTHAVDSIMTDQVEEGEILAAMQ